MRDQMEGVPGHCPETNQPQSYPVNASVSKRVPLARSSNTWMIRTVDGSCSTRLSTRLRSGLSPRPKPFRRSASARATSPGVGRLAGYASSWWRMRACQCWSPALSIESRICSRVKGIGLHLLRGKLDQKDCGENEKSACQRSETDVTEVVAQQHECRYQAETQPPRQTAQPF